MIKAACGMELKLKMDKDDFALEDSTNCANDYLEISKTEAGTKKWCGTLGKNKTLKSLNDRLEFTFSVNDAINDKGFAMDLIGKCYILSSPNLSFLLFVKT